MEIDSLGRPFRVSGFVEKRDAATGELLAVDHDLSTWYEPDGTEVTDPERIAELEAGVAERQKEGNE